MLPDRNRLSGALHFHATRLYQSKHSVFFAQDVCNAMF